MFWAAGLRMGQPERIQNWPKCAKSCDFWCFWRVLESRSWDGSNFDAETCPIPDPTPTRFVSQGSKYPQKVTFWPHFRRGGEGHGWGTVKLGCHFDADFCPTPVWDMSDPSPDLKNDWILTKFGGFWRGLETWSWDGSNFDATVCPFPDPIPTRIQGQGPKPLQNVTFLLIFTHFWHFLTLFCKGLDPGTVLGGIDFDAPVWPPKIRPLSDPSQDLSKWWQNFITFWDFLQNPVRIMSGVGQNWKVSASNSMAHGLWHSPPRLKGMPKSAKKLKFVFWRGFWRVQMQARCSKHGMQVKRYLFWAPNMGKWRPEKCVKIWSNLWGTVKDLDGRKLYILLWAVHFWSRPRQNVKMAL